MLIIAGTLTLYFVKRKPTKLGVLESRPIYSDTESDPGEILYSKSLNLSGKPDYLIKENGLVIPVEIKSGKTPNMPYLNHTMQLMAYCYLVTENFSSRPAYGYLKYPNREYKLSYTADAEQSVKDVVRDIEKYKRENVEPATCIHKEHNKRLY